MVLVARRLVLGACMCVRDHASQLVIKMRLGAPGLCSCANIRVVLIHKSNPGSQNCVLYYERGSSQAKVGKGSAADVVHFLDVRIFRFDLIFVPTLRSAGPGFAASRPHTA